MEVYSVENQRKVSDFVNREVGHCLTSTIEYILNKGYEDREAPFSWEEVENLYIDNSARMEEIDEERFEVCETITLREEKVEELEHTIEDLNDEIEELECELEIEKRKQKIGDINNQIELLNAEIEELYEKDSELENEYYDLESEQDEQQEVYEWWTVDSALYNNLKERGEVVLDAPDFYAWGRCTTGQAISLDCVIIDICKEIGILEEEETK